MRTAKYFSAPWCSPCKMFQPIMNEVANEGYSVEFINIDKDGDQTTQYNVRSVPTVVIIENGVEVDRFIGALPKRKVLQKLNG